MTRHAIVRRDWSILLLAVAASSVDAVIFLAFGVLASAQTGNTVLLGVAIAQHKLAVSLGSAVSVIGSVSGAALGELIVLESRDRHRWLSAVGWALTAELFLLGCLVVAWHVLGPAPIERTIVPLILLAAVATGIQSVATIQLGGGATTTYLTGMTTAFTTDLIQSLLPADADLSSTTRTNQISPPAPASPVPWLNLATLIVFATGAVVGGSLYLGIGEAALVLPIAAIITAIVAYGRNS